MGGDSLSVPILYEANATDFNNLGLGPLVDTTVATVTEERNGQFILEMQYPVDGIRASLIAKNRILKVDAGHKLKDQRFVIKRINRIMGNDGLSYSIYAEHISYITADYALKPNLTVNGSGNVAMTQWLNGIIDSNRIHVDSDITTENTTSWTIDKVQNARQALGGVQGSILDVWGGEYRFDNLNISLLRHRGTVSNTLLSYGRNITDFDQEENITNTYTSIYPFASYSVQNGDTSEQKILTIPDLVVDSEYVNNFPNRKIQVVDFSDKFSTDEKPTVERLAEFAKSYIKSNNVGVPTVSTKISFVDLSKTENYKEFAPLEELDLCDEVPFAFEKFGIKTTAKISRIVWNVLLDSYDSLELGELKTNLSDVINNTNNAALDAKDAANDAKNSADNAALSANGKNRNWYGADDPTFGHLSELREGDSWYMPNGEDTELYHWINGQWVFILSTKDAHDAADAADKASKEAEEAKKTANKAVDGANDAVAKAGFANDTATQAKSDAAAATQNATTALTNAGTALTNAKNALDNVTKLDQTVKTEVTNINGQLAQKVSQTTFDTLKGTVTSQGTLINQNKDAIKLKADQTYVDTIKGTVANNTAAIDLNSKEIKLKASQSDVDKLGGRVTNAEAQIKLQADQIKLTVSKTELTNVLGDYATQTWTQSQIKSTADQINLSVEQSITTSENTLNNNIANATNDMATKTWTKGQLDLTDSSLTSQISSVKDGLTTQYTQLQQTLNGVQVTANNAVTQTQYTQLSDQFTTTIANVGNGGTNLLYDGGFESGKLNGLPEFYNNSLGNRPLPRGNYAVYLYAMPAEVNDDKVWYWSLPNPIVIKANQYYVISYDYSAAGSATTASDYAVDNAGNIIFGIMMEHTAHDMSDQSAWKRYKKVFRLSTDTTITKLRFGWVANSLSGGWKVIDNVQIEDGSIAHPYSPSQNDLATSSQFTQLQNDINLRVKAGDVVNQINISPESILIDGKKVHITGQTSIDNAVIKDAMIADIKADKITAGTLNAANVNVINLNADNITTGTLKGANLSLNLNTGEVVFQKGSIKSTNGNLNIDISKGTMAVINQYKSGFYFEDGKLVLNDGWLEGTSNQPKYGSLEYNANFFTVNGLAVKGTEGVTIGTPGYNPLAMFSSVKESGIAIDKKHLEIGSVGPTIISSGNEFFMNLWTQPPFIAVGTTADGNHMTTSDPGSRISLYAEYVHIKSAYSKTASGSANVIVSEDGALVRSTSASKYKTDIVRTNISNYGEKLLELPTATWTDIAETKRYRDDPVNQIKPTRNFGMIAEDLAEAGLEMLVVRGTDGELEGINYDRIGPALIPVIAKLKNEVETLKQQLEEKTA
ncbi:phage tail spike protein [Latilactobacillus curvatus]|uniref:Phage protein n=1 Tax=Latilactobacillus curvatus JCM 1096 = DSM 20019 TaxID=1293592 RepID=A0AAJ0LH12_LATCU|nr:phage tail spike protein [Latilactobacillus curvatus]KRK92496.1 phage protein [Latilactobacillus curvatus JCM 1096 = DSM 20019]MCT3531058.1 hypothetical protein [Latilactobacillus curvatus]QAS49552.1 hypothetical protein LCU_03780 [Latilactobacillus curvatus JCM 1096 = DSM 20019]